MGNFYTNFVIAEGDATKVFAAIRENAPTRRSHFGPTAQYPSAQGNALGMRMELTCGLKGRDK